MGGSTAGRGEKTPNWDSVTKEGLWLRAGTKHSENYQERKGFAPGANDPLLNGKVLQKMGSIIGTGRRGAAASKHGFGLT